MNGLKNGLYNGLENGLNNGLFDGRNNGLNNGLYNNEYFNDLDALNFIVNANINSSIQQIAIKKLVFDLKINNLWNKMKAIYPIIGGTATSHKFNLKNPLDTNAAFRLSFIGGWTHSSTGMLPNGINAYANTFLVPSVVTTLNNIHLSAYSRSNTPQVNDFLIAAADGNGFHYTLIAVMSTYALLQQTNLASYPIYAADPNALGFYIASRTTVSTSKLYKNNAVVATGSGASTGQPSTRSFYLGGAQINVFYPSNKECAFASIGDGLTDADALAYYNAVNAYQVSLSRNV